MRKLNQKEIEEHFNEKRYVQHIVNYCVELYEARGIIYEIKNHDILHDTLLIQCGYENIIMDDDELYEYFCSSLEEVNLYKLNKDLFCRIIQTRFRNGR